MRKNNIFGHIGENVLIMDRKIPLYASLIKTHNNVKIASNVTFITHDVKHSLLNNMQDTKNYKELIGCIEIMDNVFIGANSTILSNVLVGNNVIVAAGSVVTKNIQSNSVVGGVPEKYICSFDEYLDKRSTGYPDKFSIKNQEIPNELAQYMWNDFKENNSD